MLVGDVWMAEVQSDQRRGSWWRLCCLADRTSRQGERRTGIASMTSLALTDMAPMRGALFPQLLILLDGTKLSALPGNGEAALDACTRIIHDTREYESV
jgi:hypothetical protein